MTTDAMHWEPHEPDPTPTLAIALTAEFRDGPLYGGVIQLWIPTEQNLTGLRITLPAADGYRHVYQYDGEPQPDTIEVLLRYIGQQVG